VEVKGTEKNFQGGNYHNKKISNASARERRLDHSRAEANIDMQRIGQKTMSGRR